jgi:hypothetical protein
MKFRIMVRAKFDIRTFDLPDKELNRQLLRWHEQGETPILVDIETTFGLKALNIGQRSLLELNELAEALSEYSDEEIQELPYLVDYEPIDDILENRMVHFIFHEYDSLEDLAEELVRTGDIDRLVDREDLIRDYVNFSALGEDLPQIHPFFEGSDGSYIEYTGED